MKFFVKAVLLSGAIVGAFIFLFLLNLLFSSSYNEFVQWAAEDVLKKPHLVNFIPAYFSEDRFYLLQKAIVFLAVIYFFLIVWLFRRRTKVIHYFNGIASEGRLTITSFLAFVQPKELVEKFLFWIIIGTSFFVGAYNIATIPISYDEACSYIDFVSKGPLIISTLYHTTNNHILSNILSYISCLIFPNGEIGQRLPLLFILVVNCFLLFGLLKRIVKPYQALIGLAFFAASTPVYLYSFMARGYSLVILFSLICILALRQLLLLPQRKYWVIFFLASVLGTYSIPVIGYLLVAVYVCLGVFFFIHNKEQLKFLLLTGFFSFLAVCFLYTPVFLVSGLSALKQVVSDISIKRTIFENGIQNLKSLTDFYISSNIFFKVILGLPILTGIVYVYHAYRKRGSAFLLFILIVAAMPLAVTIILQQKMFDRTWIYMTVVMSIFYAFAFSQVKQKAVLIAAIVFTYVMQLGSSIDARYYTDQKHRNFAARKTADLFAGEKMKSIYLDHQFIRPMIEYRLQLLHHPYQLYVNKSQFQKSDFDPNKKYDLIVYAEGGANPESNYQYRIIDSVKEIRVLELINE
ncbi:glycosyltransferase family 39 protein [Lacibacter sp. H407]|uniref:glycosyltransferase family 39 protein n=1 Tax=Lacibacter sp. H407 TaxID=3133423 RepID=UPI0030BAF6C4